MPNRLIHGGEIALSGVILPDAYVDSEEAGAFSPELVRNALVQFSGDVTIWVNSPGGDPVSGEAIRVLMSVHPGDVTVRIAGDAASAASLMIMGATRIEMSAGSVLMIHDPSTMTFGDVAEHQRQLDHLETLAGVYAQVYADRSGKPVAEVREMMRATVWMGPEDAIAAGFAEA